MIINILGTGALGGFYGSLLSKNYQVNFLARSNYQELKENGLEIKSVFGDFTVAPINVFNQIESLPPADFTILTSKTSANKFFYNKVASTIKEKGAFVLMQNGIGEEEKFAKNISQEIIGCSAFISSYLSAPNQVCHLGFGDLAIGVFKTTELPALISHKLQSFADLFSSLPIKVHLSNNLPEIRWRKLIWNVAFNGLTVIYDCTTDVICQTKEYAARAERLMLEIQKAANFYNVEISDDFIKKMLVSHWDQKYTPSMYLDYQRGHQLEIESIYLAPIKLAGLKNLKLPEMEKTYQELVQIMNKSA